jgi:hypothetical protein
MDGSSKNAQISALVHQLKQGEISKEQLFEKLKRLQKGEVVVAANGSATATAQQHSNTGASAMASFAGLGSSQVSCAVWLISPVDHYLLQLRTTCGAALQRFRTRIPCAQCERLIPILYAATRQLLSLAERSTIDQATVSLPCAHTL